MGMSFPWWKPDEELLAATLAEIEEGSGEVRRAMGNVWPTGSETPVDREMEEATARMGDLLEAVGTAVLLGCGDVARDRLGDLVESPVVRTLVAAAVSRLIQECLTRVLSGLMNDMYDLDTAEEWEKPVIEERIVEALTERDRVELALEGSRLVCGREPELGDDALAALASFDEVLKAELWRTIPLGDRRAAQCAWAAPEFRERLWWWYLGCDLPHTALDDMQTAARVIHLFPEAREELERMLQAEKDLDNLLAADMKASRGKAISLREYLLERFRMKTPSVVETPQPPSAVGAPLTLHYRLAASHYEEKPLYRAEELTISTDGENLIVDIEPPAKSLAERPPVLKAPGYAPLTARKAPEPERFEFSLSSPLFSAPEARLVVRLVTSERSIRLPFDEHD